MGPEGLPCGEGFPGMGLLPLVALDCGSCCATCWADAIVDLLISDGRGRDGDGG